MKHSKVKINGEVYRYYITDKNTISVKGIVSYNEYEAIKERLIKRGIYQPTDKGTWNKDFLKKRFQKWSTVELKLELEDLKDGEELIHSSEEFKSQVQAELERRMNND